MIVAALAWSSWQDRQVLLGSMGKDGCFVVAETPRRWVNGGAPAVQPAKQKWIAVWPKSRCLRVRNCQKSIAANMQDFAKDPFSPA